MKRKVASIFFVGILCVSAFFAALNCIEIVAGTDVIGDVYDGAGGGPWTSTGNPYNVIGDISIPAGQTLTIQEGVEVYFTGFFGLDVYGDLVAAGTQPDPIIITSANLPPNPGDWGSVNVQATGSASIRHAVISYGTDGIRISSSSNNEILDSNVLLNSGYGIFVEMSLGNKIENNTVSQNGRDGLFLLSSDLNTIANNTVGINPVEIPRDGGFESGTTSFWNPVSGSIAITNLKYDVRTGSYGLVTTDGTEFEQTGIPVMPNTDYELRFYTKIDDDSGLGWGAGGCNFKAYINGGLIYDENHWIYGYEWTEDKATFNTLGNSQVTVSLVQDTLGAVAYDDIILRPFGLNISGIRVEASANNKVKDNNISKSDVGISVQASGSNEIYGNIAGNISQAGLLLKGSDSNTLWDNELRNNYIGIHGYGSDLNNFTNNNVSGTGKDGLLLAESHHNIALKMKAYLNMRTGVHLMHSDNNTISGNMTLNGATYETGGIYIESSSQNNISECNASLNKDAGIYLESSTYNVISNCTVWNNDQVMSYGDGIRFADSSHNEVIGTLIHQNNATGLQMWPDSVNNTIMNSRILYNGQGIRLSGASNNSITGNNVSSNSGVGYLIMSDSNNNTISNNNIALNGGIGIWIWDDFGLAQSLDNVVYRNNFIDNVGNQAMDDFDRNSWNDTYKSGTGGGNYWSDYSPGCQDLNDGEVTPQVGGGGPDGICDFQKDLDADSTDFYPLASPTAIDSIPPAAIMDLATSNPTTSSITLTWTAPGDDDDVGTAAGYVVKYSTTGAIGDVDWATATTFAQSWTPLIAGSPESHDVTGLSPSTTYWFAIKAFDEVPNYGAISNSPSGTTLASSDVTAPAAITDLATSNPTTSSITLTWTAPGDDGNVGTATGYIVKYSTSGQITEANWAAATTFVQAWTPLVAGSQENHVVTGLSPSTTYWFAVKAFDEVPNYGAISNSPSGLTLTTPDATPPAAITDLTTSNPTTISITLTWTAPGDDGNAGTAAGYEVKYSDTGVITEANWAAATTYVQSWTPLSAGSTEIHTVSGLISGTTYWFAIKAFDEVPNIGAISNSPSGTTATPGDITQPDAITDLATSNPTLNSITLSWTAPGDDGNVGTATGYVVKYSASGVITDANWAAATTYIQSWTPQSAGTLETHAISGLSSSITYWFAIKAYDEVPNFGDISNSPSGTTSTPPETDPPEISNMQPPENSIVNDSSPTVSAQYDDVSGIDTGSVVLKIDGADVTTGATISGNGISYSSTLSDGSHTVDLSVEDMNGNLAEVSWSFTVDTTPPVADAGEDRSAAVEDEVNLNGTGSVDAIDNQNQLNFTWTITKDSSPVATLYGVSPSMVFDVAGVYDVNLTVRDRAGNEGHDTMAVSVTQAPQPPNGSPGDYWWLFLLLIVIVVILLLIFLLIRKKRKQVSVKNHED